MALFPRVLKPQILMDLFRSDFKTPGFNGHFRSDFRTPGLNGPFLSYFKTPGFYGSFLCKKCSRKFPERYPTYMRATGFERRISRSRVDADTSILQLISGVEDLVNWHLSFWVYCVRMQVHHVQSIPVSNFLWCWVNFVLNMHNQYHVPFSHLYQGKFAGLNSK